MGPRVFIPQVVSKYDHAKEKMAPTYDFSPAAAFGQLVTILDDDVNVMMLARLMPTIREALDDFSDDDFLLAVGDPAVIAACAGLILRRRRTMKLLKWDRKLRIYINMEIRP
jgi:hypothetical protein